MKKTTNRNKDIKYSVWILPIGMHAYPKGTELKSILIG